MSMHIEVFGTGCAPCKAMLRNVRAAVEQLQLDGAVDHRSRIQDMLRAGITGTPALVVKWLCGGLVLLSAAVLVYTA